MELVTVMFLVVSHVSIRFNEKADFKAKTAVNFGKSLFVELTPQEVFNNSMMKARRPWFKCLKLILNYYTDNWAYVHTIYFFYRGTTNLDWMCNFCRNT